MNIDNQKEYWNEVAESKTFTHPLVNDLLEKYLPKQSLILDYGCGYGRTVRQLSDVGYENVIGYDTSKELISRGKKDANDASLFHIDDPLDLPSANDSIDCILLFAVLTCIPSNAGQATLLNHLHAKLKPGGIIYISDYYLQDASLEIDKYSYLNGDNDNFGVFSLPEGATFRHHSKEWISSLTRKFRILEQPDIEVTTMNGHKANGFQLIGQKI